MKYSEDPTFEFSLVSKVEAEEPAAFVEFLASVPADTPVAWYSHKDEGAHPGVWMRRGMYKLKHGSFVDPSDLSAYAAQYYEAAPAGRHEAIQIGRSPSAQFVPADATPVATAGEMLAAIEALSAASVDAAEEGAQPAFEMKYLQPDYAFEFHGALTRGWHGQLYAAEDGEGETAAMLVVLR